MRKGTLGISSSQLLIFIMTMVVLSFSMVTIFTQYREASIGNRVNDLVGNAIPSIQNLSTARTHLHFVMDEVERMTDETSPSFAVSVREIQSQDKDMQTSFLTYMTLPFFPGEKIIAKDVESELFSFDENLYKYLDAFMKVDKKNRLGQSKQIHSLGTLLDRSFVRLIEFDSTQSQRLGLEISQIRTQSLFMAVVLDVLSMGLAILATYLVIRMIKASEKNLENRANELEVFAGRVAHDLKNPLTSILATIGLSSRLTKDEKNRELNDRMKVTVERMNQIIDGLLDFARTGARPIPNVSTELSSIINSTLVAVRPDAAKSGVKINIDGDPKPFKIACPSGVLASILSNLIRNALKYIIDTHHTPKVITLHVKDLFRNVHIEIEDNGPGIEPGKEELIFEPYVRANSKLDGIGLGLSTVKRLVESYGGKVGVISIWGEGSRFWFELPKA